MGKKITLQELVLFINDYTEDNYSSKINLNSCLSDFDFWDSIFKVQLLVFIEEKNGFRLNDSQIENIHIVENLFI